MAGRTGGTEDLASGVDKSGRSEYGISGTLLGNKLGEGHPVKIDRKLRDLDGDKAKRKRSLRKFRTGYISSLPRQFNRSAPSSVVSNVEVSPTVDSIVKNTFPNAAKLHTPVFRRSGLTRAVTVPGQSSVGVLPSEFPPVSVGPSLDVFVRESSLPTVMFQSGLRSYEIARSALPTSAYSRDGTIYEQGQYTPRSLRPVVSSVGSTTPLGTIVRESSGTVTTSGMPIVQAVASLRPVIESSPVLRTRVNTDNSDMNQQGLSNQSTIDHTGLWNPTWCSQMSTSVLNSSNRQLGVQMADGSMEIV